MSHPENARVTRVATALMVLVAGCALALAARPADAAYAPVIDPSRFSTTIDNPYLPLIPGTRMVFLGTGDETGEKTVVKVMYETVVVAGVECVVVRDTVTRDGALIEDTIDWYAQDDRGNVWYFGEDTKSYEGGQVSTAGSWTAGIDGAQPGIVMLARPHVGDSYRQEYYKGIAEDRARVLTLNASASVPYGSFDELLKTRDFTPLDPESVEHKYYARGIGLVLEVSHGGETPTHVELVEVSRP